VTSRSTTRGSAALMLALAGCVIGVAGMPAMAGRSPRGELLSAAYVHNHGLPFFDVRVDADGIPTLRTKAAILASQVAQGQGGVAGARGGALGLAAMVPGAAVDQDELLGTPRYVRNERGFLTAAAPGMAADDVVRAFVRSNGGLFDIDADEIGAARRERDFVTDHNGVRHFTFQQQIGGVDIHGCELRANVTSSGELINVSSTMLRRPKGDFVTPAIRIDPAAAVVVAATDAGITLTQFPTPTTARAGVTQKQTFAPSPDFRSDEPVTTELVYFAIDRGTIHPAWAVVVPQKGGPGHTYDTIVDATDGTILRRHNRLVCATTEPITMRVYTSDGVAPGSPGNPTTNGFQFPFVSQQLVTINPADVAPFSPNGWINDGANTTVGNNVNAYLDAANTNNGTPITGSGTRVFDFTYDPNIAPNASTTQQNAVIAQCFYLANKYHDILYGLGFNEAAKNFQTTNFTGQGVGGDAVRIEAQDGSGTNNANFSTTGTDGSGGRCQMYIFTGPTPDRDGGLDADIVYHELTHGTSIRLHNGLSGTQPQSMGEGWSDFVGISLLAEASDDLAGNFVTGGYTTYQLSSATFVDNYYFGIRRFPYSTDMTKNPMTYADTDTAQQNFDPSIPRSPVIGNTANQVHNAGSVWCTALNECRVNMINRYGFSGNRRMLQLVIDGMKLSVGNPTMLQARDAILQANNVNNAGVDSDILWAGFAKRGMGFFATSPASTTTSGIVESFAVPQPVNIVSGGSQSVLDSTGNGNNNGVIDPGESAVQVSIPLRNIGLNTATITSATLVSLTPTVQVNSSPSGYPTLGSNAAANSTVPGEIRVATNHACGAPISLRLDVSTNSGSYSVPFALTTGVAQFSNSSSNYAGAAVPIPDNTTVNAPLTIAGVPGTAGTITLSMLGSSCTATAGATTVGIEHSYIGDLVISLVGPSGASVIVSNRSGAGGNNLCNTVFADSATALFSATTAANAPYTGSFKPANPLSALANEPVSGTWTLRVQDAASTDTGNIRAWGLTFRTQTGTVCASVGCAVDFDNNGVRQPADIFAFLNAYFANDPRADWNNNGTREPADIFAFLNAYFAGC
jgi:subtilisin-like proprotein convertase family protein